MGRLLEVLGNDMYKFETYVDNYGVPAAVTRTAPVENLLRFWDANKVDMYKVLGQNLIVSKEISFDKDVNELDNLICCSIFDNPDENVRDFCTTFKRLYRNYLHNNALYYGLSTLSSSYSLATNVYAGDTFEYPNQKTGKMIKINHGMKTIKAWAKIAEAENLDMDVFETIRLLHSQILNQKTVKGNLCLSIHPLDYATMSDNECDWSSCMSWMEQGCYRRGTVEMMNSEAVVVAYLTSKEEMRIGNGHTWNSKKWRELFIVTPEFITNIKSYPYKNEQLTGIALKWLKDLAEENNFGTYTDDVIHYNHCEDFTYNGHEYCFEFDTYAMYNDFNDNQVMYMSRNLSELPTDNENYYVNYTYSGPAVCLACGEQEGPAYFDSEGRLTCEKCSVIGTCEHCGAKIYAGQEVFEFDGKTYCEYCGETEFKTDAVTGELNFREKMHRIQLCFNGCLYLSKDYIYVTDETYNDMIKSKEYFINEPTYDYGYDWMFIKRKDATDKLLRLFGFNGPDAVQDLYNQTREYRPWWFERVPERVFGETLTKEERDFLY